MPRHFIGSLFLGQCILFLGVWLRHNSRGLPEGNLRIFLALDAMDQKFTEVLHFADAFDPSTHLQGQRVHVWAVVEFEIKLQ